MNTLHLGSISITIECDEQIANRLDVIFGGWDRFQAGIKFPLSSGPKILYRLELLTSLPHLPIHPPKYIESLGNPSGPGTTVAIYEHSDGITLHFGAGALVRIYFPAGRKGKEFYIRSAVTPKLLQSGRMEDVLFASVAPILRRHGLFMAHAFAVSHGQSATLLVGPSGSGKTTSGLALVAAGWGYLANDVTMLQLQKPLVLSLPTPGGIGISKKTAEIVPGLSNIWRSADKFEAAARLYFPPDQIVSGWAEAAYVSRICFPEITLSGDSYLKPLGKALALARLMENSIDRWDHEYLSEHISLLEALCRQSECFKLYLGRNVNQLAELMANQAT